MSSDYYGRSYFITSEKFIKSLIALMKNEVN